MLGLGKVCDSMEEFGFSLHRQCLKSLKRRKNGGQREKKEGKGEEEKVMRSILVTSHLCAKLLTKAT